jgi:hypothetical protein
MLIILMMEVVSTSEMSVSFYEITLCSIPEDGQLQTQNCENPKSRTLSVYITDRNHPFGLHCIREGTGSD